MLKDSRLSRLADGLIADPLNDIHISPASYWEIAIKVGKKKLDLLGSYDDFVKQGIVGNDFTILPIETKHTSSLTTMPTHHKDPFDRLIIAQTLVERIPLISEDAAVGHYGVARLWSRT